MARLFPRTEEAPRKRPALPIAPRLRIAGQARPGALQAACARGHSGAAPVESAGPFSRRRGETVPPPKHKAAQQRQLPNGPGGASRGRARGSLRLRTSPARPLVRPSNTGNGGHCACVRTSAPPRARAARELVLRKTEGDQTRAHAFPVGLCACVVCGGCMWGKHACALESLACWEGDSEVTRRRRSMAAEYVCM